MSWREGGRVAREPIAVIGMGCRLPGRVEGPDDLWRLLVEGRDAITEVPPSRFDIEAYYDPRPATPGKLVTRFGGFLDDVAGFDASFFGISPREAARMDPQQRLLLEVSWEALEDSGEVAERLVGTRTGVFVGIIYNDYEDLQNRFLEGIDIYAYVGGCRAGAAGRISYALGLQGPNVVVDTACSSSLVAVHLACQSLRLGESDVALAAGANLVLAPEMSMGFSSGNMLAPDGRCKAFDARGDGFVRSDGVGVVVLKRLSRALADGNRIHALIRGSASNNDGRGAGLMTPSRAGQEAVLRAAYDDAGVPASSVQYVECHGTGTRVGDPIEVGALAAVLGESRDLARPCRLGSVKTNVGHTEGAAGVTGLIKAVLCLEKKEIPKTLHVRELNPSIPWSEIPFQVQREHGPWPSGERPARAAVSSFGIAGSNAHVVLEEAPASEPAPASRSRVVSLPLSAHSEEALRAAATAYRGFLADLPDEELWDVCFTASVRRGHHARRLAVVGATPVALAEGLTAYLDGTQARGLSAGPKAVTAPPKIAFVFPGQGSQWLGMGRRLMTEQPAFREALERCDQAIAHQAGWSVVEELNAEVGTSRLDRIDVVQPLLFAVEVALAEMWRSFGVQPSAVIGHSMGEIAAACVGGAISLEDAARIICVRSRLLMGIRGRGAMALVELTPAEARQVIAGHEALVTLGVSNGPKSVVLSGDPGALQEIVAGLESRDVFCRMVKVDVASHSPQVEPLHDEFMRLLADVHPQQAAVPFFSTAVPRFGRRSEDSLGLDASYWWKNLRQPVLFYDAVQLLIGAGYDAFVEMSPHPILTAPIQETLVAGGKSAVVLPSLVRDEDELASVLASLGELYVAGASIDWTGAYPHGRCVALPRYPWQHESYWFEPQPERTRSRRKPGAHPLLDTHVALASGAGHVWESELSLRDLPYLADHRVQQTVLLPGAAFVDLTLAAASDAGLGGAWLRDVAFEHALVLGDEPRGVQLTWTAEALDTSSVRLHARSDDSKGWMRVAKATCIPGAPSRCAEVADAVEAVQQRCQEEIEGAAFYASLGQHGLDYGPAFQTVARAWRRDGEALGRLQLLKGGDAPAPGRPSPTLLDGALQLLYAAQPGDWLAGTDELYVPVSIDAVRQYQGPPAAWGHATLSPANGGILQGDVTLRGDDGTVVLEARGVRMRKLAGHDTAVEPGEWLYDLRWERKPRPPVSTPAERGSWIVLADNRGVAREVERYLAGRHERVIVVERARRAGDDYQQLTPDRAVVRPDHPEDFERLLGRALGAGAPPCHGVVHLWSLDSVTTEALSAREILAEQTAGCLSALHLVQSIAKAGWRRPPRLWLVTSGAQHVGPSQKEVMLVQSPLWGMGRVIATEHPELRCTRVDLGPEVSPIEIRALDDELGADDQEDEIALRATDRFVARLGRFQPQPDQRPPAARRASAARGEGYRLDMGTAGLLDELGFRSQFRRRPGRGEVELRVRAVGLNFHDVMVAMGLVPTSLPDGRPDFGWECAGEVVAAGEGVGLRVGDPVVAILAPCFASYVTTSADRVFRRPAGMSAEDAATIPIAMLTAHYALNRLGRLQKGERVLIHAASGGVGMAAIQLAKRAGAEIFATAGSEPKRALLRSLGIGHVSDSRSLRFAEDFLRETDGQGVDVVLNSLAGEFIPKSLSLLRPGGRFLELGKVDILRNQPLGMSAFRDNRSFVGVDLSQLVLENPRLVKELFQEILPLLAGAGLRPLPHRDFPVGKSQEAFRFLAEAKHTGKVVVQIGDEEVTLASADGDGPPLHGDATYLITGGLGGLGLVTARALVEQGARHVALVARHAPSVEALAKIKTLEELGARVSVFAADVAQESQVAEVMARLRAAPPLRGIVHAAGGLADGILTSLDAGRFLSVFEAKVAGAWNLHRLTREHKLDFFILYSSIAGIVGSPGQANYAAANAFLDALAQRRRRQGRPAIAIDWGPWSEVGLAARADRGGRLALRGLGSIPPEVGRRLLVEALQRAPVQIAAMRFDASQWLQSLPSARAFRMFDALSTGPREAPAAPPRSLRETLADLQPAERSERLVDYLRAQVGRTLKLPPAKVGPDVPLSRLGIDSLMAVEVKSRLQSDLAVTVPAVRLLDAPSLRALATALAQELAAAGERAKTNGAAVLPKEQAADLIERIDRLSGQEVDELLGKLLHSAGEGWPT